MQRRFAIIHHRSLTKGTNVDKLLQQIAEIDGKINAILAADDLTEDNIKEHDKFTSALKRNRDTTMEDVRQNYGQGRVLSAEKALSVGMIDRILTFEELIGKLTGGDSGGGAKASTMMLKLRQEQRERETAKYF